MRSRARAGRALVGRPLERRPHEVGEPVSTAAAVQNKQARSAQDALRVGPSYGGDGALLLPEDYRRWVFIGSSLGMSYSEGQRGMEMFHETLMEPTAYQYFVETGTFREGTMLALILHGTGERVPPMRQGRYATEVHGVEMAVKDSAHRPEKWAYYNFGGMSGLRTTAQAMPKESCYTGRSATSSSASRTARSLPPIQRRFRSRTPPAGGVGRAHRTGVVRGLRDAHLGPGQ